MSTTIGRDHVVNLVTGNPHPFAVHFDLVVVATMRLWVERQSIRLQHEPWPSFLLSVE
jgi:hypothetical protein